MYSTHQKATGFEFPCNYQIKAMGQDEKDFKEIVINIIEQHCAKVLPQQVSCKPSRNGKYLSVNVTIQAHSLAHLDAIYADLTAHEKVLMRL